MLCFVVPAYANQLTDLNKDGRINALDVMLFTGHQPGPLLAAATLPDTIEVSCEPAEPGKILELDITVKFRSAGTSGFLVVLAGLPSQLGQGQGVDITDGDAPPTEPGSWWYEWTDFGVALNKIAVDYKVFIDTTHSLTAYILGSNIDLLAQIGVALNGINSDKSGTVVKIYFRVPADMPESTYPLTLAENGAAISKQPLSQGIFSEPPFVFLEPLVVQEVPEFHRADVNQDERVDIFDLLELLRILSEKDY